MNILDNSLPDLLFCSGEKTSMQGWPSLLEVKGRVRLDAFEKFLQELPLSRSRTIMVLQHMLEYPLYNLCLFALYVYTSAFVPCGIRSYLFDADAENNFDSSL